MMLNNLMNAESTSPINESLSVGINSYFVYLLAVIIVSFAGPLILPSGTGFSN